MASRQVRDPLEGVAPNGTIRTGADRSRIADIWADVLGDVQHAVHDVAPDAAVHLYGSVATGQAVRGRSDVDVLTIDLPVADAEHISRELTAKYADLCRGVQLGAAQSTDLVGDHDEAYGNRVFLRHYCVHLAGPDTHRPPHDHLADARAARGFNGDIGRHADRWRRELDGGDPPTLATRIARKTLLAVAGLVSVHDATWTTDRELAVRRWSEVDPDLVDGLTQLARWTTGVSGVSASEVRDSLDRTVTAVVRRFADDIGLWVR